MPRGESVELERRLVAHLEHWLGSWPPSCELEIVGSVLRSEPGWDGVVREMVGVSTPLGAVVSVQPERVAEAQALLDEGGVAAVHSRLGEIIAGRSGSLMTGVFRWGSHIADLDDVGEWLETDDPRVPEWLRPFNGPVLVALDTDGAYAAGVGRKRHDDLCQEIAVATELAHRGRGLARRLVAQAARRIVDEGCVATYLHRPDNAASAAVAEAAGFPDLGWHILGLPPSR